VYAVSTMKRYSRCILLGFALMALAILAQTAFAQSRDDEIEQMKAQMQEMAKTIKTLQSKVAALEKEKTAADKQGATSAKPTTEHIARTVPVRLPSTPPITVPAREQSQTRDRNTFLDDQWPAPRVNNAPIDPTLKGFLPILGNNLSKTCASTSSPKSA
jgi:outer membrane murein-binding lipoprotein Lpp